MMKKIIPILFSFLCFGCLSAKSIKNNSILTAELGDTDYAIIASNYLESPYTLYVSFYDDQNNLIQRRTIGTVNPNKTEIFRYKEAVFFEAAKFNINAYICYEAYLNNNTLITDTNIAPPISINDLLFNYTRVHFSENSNYITNYNLRGFGEQKSIYSVYDESYEYTEFKLYDDLSWLKGTWRLTEGYGNDTLRFEDGSPYGIIDEYNDGDYKSSETVMVWISLNDFSDTFYVNSSKNKIKTVHPYALDPDVLIISYYEKVE